ncbi:MAG TPA: malto-oligosyltrehalose synthase, partial [Blastocatellia bacterium]
NPDIGTEQEFAALAGRLKQNGMGIVMDVVPNHMCIADSANRWWNDVLENGPSSPFARHFDIDWQPPKADLINKVLLPVLGDQYGRVLENQEIKVKHRQGAFFAHYYETRFPIAPRTYALLLDPLIPYLKLRLGEYHYHVLEMESIVTALRHLPPRTETDPARIKERHREKEIIKRRLAALLDASDEVSSAIKESVRDLNGVAGQPRSFDRLEDLLAAQAYRLCFWRVASDEINYRRFFDINELAAIRVEERAVFTAAHELPFRFMKRGWITGLRIDHVDGLLDPEQYFRDLQRGCLSAMEQAHLEAESGLPSRARHARQPRDAGRPCYVVVEKILGDNERLRPQWAVHGTTGYDFLNLLNGVFVDAISQRPFSRLYERFTEQTQNFSDLVYECKKIILQAAMSGELHVLARRLDRISEQHRYSRDFTLNSLQNALREVIACFPVYRTYTRREQAEVDADDRRHILSAIHEAKRRNPATSPSIFDFISSLLLLDDPEGLDASEQAKRRDFVLRLQQMTGPVMAKGLEDTAFYRYCPLASLNE